MTGYILLDANIYRQFGVKFLDHIDYVNLQNFCYASGYELSISDIVALEYIDFFQKEILQQKIDKLRNLFLSINSIPYFKSIEPIEDLDSRVIDAISEFKLQLYAPPHKIRSHYTDSHKLTQFLLDNKQFKESTRDYLIWTSVLEFANKIKKDKVCFITNDKIFKENENLRSEVEKDILDRIEIYDSITDFLHINGFKIDFVTEEFLQNNIERDLIITEFYKRPTDILSYISVDFWNYKGKLNLIQKDIEYLLIDKFYTYIDPDDNKHKFLAHILLKPYVKFEIPKDFTSNHKSLNEFQLAISKSSLNTYDSQGNPIYNEEVMFLVGGILNMDDQSIQKQEVYDFFLDYL